MNAVSFSTFTNVHQNASISANSEGRVFYFEIPRNMVGFIQKMASNYFSNATFKFIIDGETVEGNIQRSVAAIDQPTSIDPPYVVRNYIEWRAANSDSSSHTFEVLIDGYLIQKEELEVGTWDYKNQ